MDLFKIILSKILKLVTRDFFFLDENPRVINSIFILIEFQRNNFRMKRKNKHCMKRKKQRSGCNRMIFIHSNVCKFFKKQHTVMLYSFANRCTLDQSTNSMNKKFFL